MVLAVIFGTPTAWLLVSHALAKHALERYKAQLRASGEKLTVDELLPPRVPPEQNGAKLFIQAFPYLQNQGVLEDNPPTAMLTVAAGKAMIGWQQPCIVSKDGGEITNTWKDIELELKKCAPGLELLYQAAARPGFDLSMDYRNSYLPGTTNRAEIREASVLLSAAAVFDLNRGETPSAVTDVHTLLVLVGGWKDERLLASQSFRSNIGSFACAAQWELLQATNLTDPELAMLQHDWDSMEFIKPMENALKMERVLSLSNIDRLRTSNSPSASWGSGSFSGSGSSSTGAFDFIKGLGRSASRTASDTLWRLCWSYHDELRDLQGLQLAIETVRRIETNGLSDNALAEQGRKVKALGLYNQTNNWLRNHLNDDMLEVFDSVPGIYGKMLNRMPRVEAQRRIAITAIALKRYQLRHGAWPADLNALAPEFLSQIPRDPANCQPLQYRPSPDGTFTLYSTSWAWPQPATEEEIQIFYSFQARMRHR